VLAVVAHHTGNGGTLPPQTYHSSFLKLVSRARALPIAAYTPHIVLVLQSIKCVRQAVGRLASALSPMATSMSMKAQGAMMRAAGQARPVTRLAAASTDVAVASKTALRRRSKTAPPAVLPDSYYRELGLLTPAEQSNLGKRCVVSRFMAQRRAGGTCAWLGRPSTAFLQ
jgi:hypothetical protein